MIELCNFKFFQYWKSMVNCTTYITLTRHIGKLMAKLDMNLGFNMGMNPEKYKPLS